MNNFTKSLLLPLIAFSFVACTANGGGGGGGAGGGGATSGPGVGGIASDDGIDENGDPTGAGGGSDTGFPNDPLGPGGDTVGGVIVEDDGTGTQTDVDVAYGATTSRFFCSASGADATEEGRDGLVGGIVGGVLDPLGGAPVNELTAGISEPLQAIDLDMKTASTFTTAATALGIIGVDLVNSLDQIMYYNSPQNGYAVFAISFPPGTLDLGVLTTVTINTFFDEDPANPSTEPTEPPVSFDASAVDLLGQSGFGPGYAFVGRKVSVPYNRSVISLEGDVLAADVGEAMYVHEVCVGGSIVEVTPAP